MTTIDSQQLTGQAWFHECSDFVSGLSVEQQARIVGIAHSSYLEGVIPTREQVARLVEVERGILTADEAVAQVLAHANRIIG